MGCFDCLLCWKNNSANSPKVPKPATNSSSTTTSSTSTSSSSSSSSSSCSLSSSSCCADGSSRRLEDHYDMGKKIGSGSYSVVREAICKASHEKFAIKCIRRQALTHEDDQAILLEVEILRQIQHPNILRLLDFYETTDYYFLVTEFVSGGELFDRIVEKTFYSEKEARDLVQILLEAIKYCHDQGIVHRDLKPENILLTSHDDDASIKLADFGFAKKVVLEDQGLVTTCGTPGYVAPEIISGANYGKPVDIWSLGVITYILLAGYPPFHDDNQGLLFQKIKAGKFQYDSPYWDNVSQDAKDFINRMIVVNPSKRATVDDLLQHKWITGQDINNEPLTSALTELRRFHARKKFKAAVHSVKATISMNRLLASSSSRMSRGDSASKADSSTATATATTTTIQEDEPERVSL